MQFCTRHDSAADVTSAKIRCNRWAYLKLERPHFWSNFEFDRNIVSGMGVSWIQGIRNITHCMLWESHEVRVPSVHL